MLQTGTQNIHVAKHSPSLPEITVLVDKAEKGGKRKERHRKGKQLAQGHAEGQWQRQEHNPSLLIATVLPSTHMKIEREMINHSSNRGVLLAHPYTETQVL